MGTGDCGLVLLLYPSFANSSISEIFWSRARSIVKPRTTPFFLRYFISYSSVTRHRPPPSPTTEETSCFLKCEIDDLRRLRVVRSWTREPVERISMLLQMGRFCQDCTMFRDSWTDIWVSVGSAVILKKKQTCWKVMLIQKLVIYITKFNFSLVLYKIWLFCKKAKVWLATHSFPPLILNYYVLCKFYPPREIHLALNNQKLRKNRVFS